MWRSPAVVVMAALVGGCAPPIDGESTEEGATSLVADDVTPEAILAKLQTCAHKLSSRAYARDSGGRAEIDVCGLKHAVFWKADMDIDCDGKRSDVCNSHTDPAYQPDTAGADSRGEPLDAAKVPFVVVPGKSSRWDFEASDISMASIALVIYNGKMEFGIVGDIGPTSIIGEASYAMAKSLGINPNPSTGGVDSGVTYIIFTGADGEIPIPENHDEAVFFGKQRAARLIREN